MSSKIEPQSFGTYPRNDQRPYWPQAFRPVIFLMAVAFALSAMVMITLAIRSGNAYHALEFTGYVGGLSMMALLSLTALRESGFRHVRRSSRIHRIHDPRHGDGIIVPMRRGLTAPVMIVLLGSCIRSCRLGPLDRCRKYIAPSRGTGHSSKRAPGRSSRRRCAPPVIDTACHPDRDCGEDLPGRNRTAYA